MTPRKPFDADATIPAAQDQLDFFGATELSLALPSVATESASSGTAGREFKQARERRFLAVSAAREAELMDQGAAMARDEAESILRRLWK